MMAIQSLQKDHVSAHYDEEKRVAYIIYSGILGSEASSAAYQWLNELIEEIGIDQMYGEIFDFTSVRQFQPDNLIDARKNSRKLNLRVNIHETPVAMIVRDSVQREILRGPMRNVPENKRKRIVETEEEAFEFFKEWYEQNPTSE